MITKMIVSHLRRVHVGMSRWKENLLGRQIRSVGQCRLVEEILFTIFLKHIWHTIANTNTKYKYKIQIHLLSNIVFPSHLLKDGLQHRVWSHSRSL